MMDFSRSKFDIIGKAKLWYTFSIIVIVLGMVGIVKNMATEGFPLIRGIDFTGGSILQLEFDNWDTSKDTAIFGHDIQLLVDSHTEKSTQVQTTLLTAEESDTGNPAVIVHIRADSTLLENPEEASGLYDEIRSYGGDYTILEETEVGAVIGKELTTKALIGVLVGLLGILVYITIRLSFDFAVFAVVALFHDVIILIGVYALLGFEINSPFVAVLLTVLGYSINDTIVIYDRIRENMKVKRHLPFDRLVNQSLLETMARSINTSFTTLLVILALLIFGGISLRTFMVGLGVGVLTGTYSSIFVASILLVSWRIRGKGLTVIADKIGGGATGIILEDDEEELIGFADKDEIEESEAVEQITVTQPQTKPKPKKSKQKRRRRRY
ncbi:protein translocase subunit SecF [bacterium]|nr:protein translocase subunit SecF [bacterium]